MPRPSLRLLALPLLLALLAAQPAVAVGAAVTTPLTLVSGPSPFASCTSADAGNGARTYTNGEVEPSVAVNPASPPGQTDLIGVWQQDRHSTGAARGIVAGSSHDGGASWRQTALPFSSCASSASNFAEASDPWVSIGPDGTAYASALAIGNDHIAVSVVTSADGGNTWGNLRNVILDSLSGHFDDKESVTADPTRPGVAYVVWDRIHAPFDKSPNSSWFAKTTDAGKSWSTPLKIVPSGRDVSTIGNQIVVDPKTHVLYDFFLRQGEHPVYRKSCKKVRGNTQCRKIRITVTHPTFDWYISFVESTDGGKRWSRLSNVTRITTWSTPSAIPPLRTGGMLPEATFDPVGRKLYVVWTDGRFNGGKYEEVAISGSGDGGRHWTTPARVNTPTGKRAFTPSIAVDTTGVVGVTYYDLRSQTDPSVPLADYWFTASTDSGQHFGDETHLAGPFDLRWAPFSGGFFLGDYAGLAADKQSFHSFFVAANTGDAANPSDVFSTTITP